MSAGPPPALVQLLTVARAYQRSRALTVAAELGVADVMAGGPRSVDELAAATGAHPEALYRLLRALAAVGVFSEDGDRRFGLTEQGEYLRSDHPLSAAPVAMMFGADYEWKAWGELGHSVRTGETAAVHALGVDVWEHRRRHPAHGEVFDAAMRTLSSAEAAALLAAHDFGRYGVVADIGGGTGAALASVLVAAPGARGVLFDQPAVVAGAAPVLERAGVADRVEVVGGSFFDSVPPGADAYLLRRVLHDWADDEAAAILRCVRRSIGPGGRLVVVDAVVGPPGEDDAAKFLDLMMMVSAGGRERTEPEWVALLAAGGFRYEGAARLTVSSHVIEAAPS